MRENIIKKRKMSFAFEKTPRISLSCKLVPVQYREYEYGLLKDDWRKFPSEVRERTFTDHSSPFERPLLWRKLCRFLNNQS